MRTGVYFTNVLRAALDTDDLIVCLRLGSARLKAARKQVNDIDPSDLINLTLSRGRSLLGLGHGIVAHGLDDHCQLRCRLLDLSGCFSGLLLRT